MILNLQPVRVVLIYVIISAFWIAYTDQAVEQIFTDPAVITRIQTFKGWFFVTASALLLFWVISRSGRRLEKHRDQYKAMLDDAKVGIAKMVRGKIISSNPAFMQIIGLDSQELEKRTFLKFIEEQDREELDTYFSEVKYNGYLEKELRIFRKGKKKQWVQINASKHKDKDGDYIQLILQDINDKKNYQIYHDLLLQMMLSIEPAEDFLSALEDVVKSLCKELNWEYGIALTPDKPGVFKRTVSWYRLDPLLDEFDAKVELYSFDSGRGLAGLTLESKQAIWIEDIETDARYLYSDDAVDADLKTVVSIPVVVKEEVIALLVLYNRGLLAPDEELIKLFTAIGRDVASKLENQKKEDEKKKLEQSLNYALKSASMATWDMDLETGEIIRSPNHHELFGLKVPPETWHMEDFLGKIVKEDRMNVKRCIIEAVSDTKGYNVEFRIKHKDGIRWLWSRGDLQFDTYGEPLRLSGVLSDITEKKHFQIYTELLLQIILSIEPVEDLNTAYRNILEVICSENNWHFGEAWEHGEEGLMKRLVSYTPEGETRALEFDRYTDTFISQPGNGLPYTSANTGKLHWISDLENAPGFLRAEKATEAGFRSVIAVPVLVDGQSKAVLMFFSKYALNRDKDAVRFFDAIRNNIGIKLENKRAHKQLQKTEEALEYALSSSSMAAWDIDLETGRITMSENYSQVTGINVIEPVFDESLSGVIEEDRELFRTHLREAIEKKGKIDFEFRIRNDQGEIRWLRTQGHYSDIDNKKRISGIVRDVTERKKIEMDLESEREFLQQLFETIPVMITVYSPDLSKFEINAEFERATGWSDDELEEVDILKQIYQNKAYRDDFISFMKNPESRWKEFEMVTKFEKKIQTTWTNIKLSDTKFIGIGLDITERKRMEEELKENEERLQLTTNSANIGLWEWNPQTGEVIIDEVWARLVGYERGELEPVTIETWNHLLHPHDLIKFENAVDNYFSGNSEVYECEVRMRHKEGFWVWILDRGRTVDWDENGKPVRMVGTHIDITELKHVEHRLANKQKQLLKAQEIARMGYWEFNVKDRSLRWSDMVYTIFGLDKDRFELTIENFHSIVHEDDRASMESGMYLLKEEGALEQTYRVVTPDGEIIYIQERGEIEYREEGNTEVLTGTVLDITDLKKVEHKLDEERRRFETAAKTVSDVIWDWDIKSGMMWWSEGFEANFGFNRSNEPSGLKSWSDHIHKDDLAQILKKFHQVVDSHDENEWQGEYRFFNAYGELRDIEDRGIVIRDKDGQPLRMLGAMIDVTAEKEAERILRESEEQYRRFFEQNPHPMWIFDPDTSRILQVNQSAVDRYGYTRKEFENMTIFDFRPENEKLSLEKKTIYHKKGLINYEGWTHLHKDGTKIIVNISALDIQYKGQECRLVVASDITEQRKAEERVIGSIIEGSENERRRIAKELHDGLGQHLAAASMNLESVYDELQRLPEVKWGQYKKGLKLLSDAITESRRISQNLLPKAIEDFGLSLAVHSLIDDIRESPDVEITYRDNIEGVKFAETIELNMYRIIQEGLSNAIRHSGSEKIDVQLILDDNHLICTIEDSGRGFDYAKKKGSGMGLSSINNRVNAMAGEVEFLSEKEKGTLVTIIVPVNPL